jgi:hypothetical protein
MAVSNFRTLSRHSAGELRKTTKNLSHDSRSQRRDLNPGSPEYEAGELSYLYYHAVKVLSFGSVWKVVSTFRRKNSVSIFRVWCDKVRKQKAHESALRHTADWRNSNYCLNTSDSVKAYSISGVPTTWSASCMWPQCCQTARNVDRARLPNRHTAVSMTWWIRHVSVGWSTWPPLICILHQIRQNVAF